MSAGVPLARVQLRRVSSEALARDRARRFVAGLSAASLRELVEGHRWALEHARRELGDDAVVFEARRLARQLAR